MFPEISDLFLREEWMVEVHGNLQISHTHTHTRWQDAESEAGCCTQAFIQSPALRAPVIGRAVLTSSPTHSLRPSCSIPGALLQEGVKFSFDVDEGVVTHVVDLARFPTLLPLIWWKLWGGWRCRVLHHILLKCSLRDGQRMNDLIKQDRSNTLRTGFPTLSHAQLTAVF